MANQMNEFRSKNLLSTISRCLDEHRVTISGKKGNEVMRLIEVSVPSSTFSDFIATYNGDVLGFQKELAKKVMGEGISEQTYGVLINSDLQYSFAFNRKFGDLDRKKNKIHFTGVEELLLSLVNSSGAGAINPIIPNVPTRPGRRSGGFRRGGGLVMKYALEGKEDDSVPRGSIGKAVFERVSLLDRIKAQYDSDKRIGLLGENGVFYLDNTHYKTSTADDFIATYGDEINDFQKELARRIFGKESQDNEYGVLFDSDLRMRFAFNSAFARYDSKSKKIVFTSPEEVLLNSCSGIDLSSSTSSPVLDDDWPSGSGSMEMRYALQGKK